MTTIIHQAQDKDGLPVSLDAVQIKNAKSFTLSRTQDDRTVILVERDDGSHVRIDFARGSRGYVENPPEDASLQTMILKDASPIMDDLRADVAILPPDTEVSHPRGFLQIEPGAGMQIDSEMDLLRFSQFVIGATIQKRIEAKQ